MHVRKYHWTEEQIEFLKAHYPSRGSKYVAEQLEKPRYVVRQKASQLKIRFEKKGWTEEEIALLKKIYPKHGLPYAAQVLNKSKGSVKGAIVRLRLHRNGFSHWTEWEVRYLRRNYGNKSTDSIARTLKRTRESVKLKAQKLGLCKERAQRWTDAEKETLRQLYPNPKISLAEVARRIGRPEKGVVKQARKMGLDRPYWPHEWTEEEHRFLVQHYKRMSFVKIAERLGLSVSAVSHYANRHGFRRRPSVHSSKQKTEKALETHRESASGQHLAHTISPEVQQQA